MGLKLDHLPEGASILFDSAPIIYFFEGHPLAARFEPVFEAVDAGRLRAIATPVTLAEVVAGPMKHGRAALAERYRHALTTGHGWTVRPIDADVAMLAAQLRIEHRMKLPDALQLAAAVRAGCAALVTHDRDFPSDAGVLILGQPE